MRKVLLLAVVLLGSIIAGVITGLLLPAEWRAKLSRPPRDLIGRMEERIPDE